MNSYSKPHNEHPKHLVVEHVLPVQMNVLSMMFLASVLPRSSSLDQRDTGEYIYDWVHDSMEGWERMGVLSASLFNST